MHNTDQLFESLFKRNFRSVDTKAFLTALTKEYPYFTAAQFYLLKQSASNSRDFASQAAKTSLLFNNPFWLNYQLNREEKTTLQPDKTLGGKAVDINIKKEDLPGQPLIEAEENSFEQAELKSTPIVNGSSVEDVSDETATENPNLAADNLYAETEKPEELQPKYHSEVMSENAEEETNVAIPQGEDNRLETAEKVPQPQASVSYTEDITSTETDQSDAEKELNDDIQLLDKGIHGNDEVVTEKDFHTTEFIGENNAIQSKLEKPAIPDTSSIVNAEEDDKDDEGIINDTDNTSEKDMQPMILNLNFDVKATTTEDTISYQPLHTSDYFASLGIKLNENGLPVDRLGKQLKSFTDWLKVMKKIHPDQLPQTDELTEQTIQELAEISNKKGDVLTEAMADVLIQQGKLNKAVEVYQKLSLLNPSKSAYFAAKIDNIKR
jgi:hypothetical protein